LAGPCALPPIADMAPSVNLSDQATRWQSVRHSECRDLVGLQGNFLGEHGIASDDQVFRSETPAAHRLLTAFIELFDVSLKPMVNAVDGPAIAADNLEISMD